MYQQEDIVSAPIVDVITESISEEMGIEAGDNLISINGQDIEDIIDYQFYSQDDLVVLEIEKADGEVWSVEIEKDWDEDLGLVFDDIIFDRMRVCQNRCLFCFVDQLPAGMRKTLYIKDDDYRYSFLYGNYITLTNLKEKDWCKIIDLHLSPLYVSVHCMDPELRVKILGNKRAANIHNDLQRLYEAGIKVHTQIVLCPGVNDGEVLEESIKELAAFYPCVQSVGIVPVGLTGHRNQLYDLQSFNPSQSTELIQLIDTCQSEFRKSIASGFVYLADEFYIKAGKDIPAADYYDDYCQIENGIGLARVFMDEFKVMEESLPRQVSDHEAYIVTGVSAIPVLESAVQRLNQIKGLTLHLLAVENRFFGGNVTVTGLLTGRDILNTLGDKYKDKRVILPEIIFREGYDILLDDISLDDIRQRSGADIRTVDGSAESLVRAILE
jgi:putative radical SAM enzyme (TIGR03279 family)